MARARNIKPVFFANDLLAEVPPMGRLLFAGLWTIADRLGRLEDRPKKIKAQVLPYDEANVDALLTSLSDRGFILRYTVAGEGFIQVVNWARHQQPHVKEGASTIPAPDESDSSTVQAPCKEGASTIPAPIEPHIKTPDSLNLIPDSLNLIPDTGGAGGEITPLRKPPKAAKPPRLPSWAKPFPDQVVECAIEIVDLWPHHKADVQPEFDPKKPPQPVPVTSTPALAERLAEIVQEGGKLEICKAIAERSVREFRSEGKWIKAAQHFFGKLGPWKAYYQAHVTNEALTPPPEPPPPRPRAPRMNGELRPLSEVAP